MSCKNMRSSGWKKLPGSILGAVALLAIGSGSCSGAGWGPVRDVGSAINAVAGIFEALGGGGRRPDDRLAGYSGPEEGRFQSEEYWFDYYRNNHGQGCPSGSTCSSDEGEKRIMNSEDLRKHFRAHRFTDGLLYKNGERIVREYKPATARLSNTNAAGYNMRAHPVTEAFVSSLDESIYKDASVGQPRATGSGNKQQSLAASSRQSQATGANSRRGADEDDIIMDPELLREREEEAMEHLQDTFKSCVIQ